MTKSILSLFTLALFAFTTTSCSKLKEMGDNASKASENSGRAADAASESREEIAFSRLMGRSGGASAARNSYFEKMLEMESFEGKVTQAAKYFKAFEYQLFTGQRYDTQPLLDRLYKEAIDEFFRSIIEVNNGKKVSRTKLSPFKILKGAKLRSYNVYALAVAMHSDHIVQAMVTKDKFELNETRTMYSLIKEALIRIEDVEAGDISYSELKEHEQAVYDNKQEALAMIQARMDMLLTMALTKVSTIKENKIDALKLITYKKSFYSTFASLNLGEQATANKYLDAARKVKVFLDDIQEDIFIQKTVRKFYKKMIVPSVTSGRIYSIGTDQNLVEHRKQLENFFDINNDRVQTKRI